MVRPSSALPAALAFLLLAAGPLASASVPMHGYGYGGGYDSLNLDQQQVLPGGDLRATVTRGYAWAEPEAVSGTLRLVSLELPDATTAASWQSVRGREVASRAISGTSPQAATFDDLAAGLYRVEWTPSGGGDAAMALAQVTRLGLVGRTVGEDLVVWAVDAQTGQGVGGVQLRGAANLTTDSEGIAVLPVYDIVAATSALGPAVLAVQQPYYWWWGGSQDQRLLVQTDRPVYRPGQEVHAKLTGWSDGGAGLHAAAGQHLTGSVSVWTNGREQRVHSFQADLSAYGTARADFTLPAGAPLGTYSIQAMWDGVTFQGSFDVEEYRIPAFAVTVEPASGATVAGDELAFVVRAQRFNGAPVDQGRVEYTILPEWGYGYGYDYGYDHGYESVYPGGGMRILDELVAGPSSLDGATGNVSLGPDGTVTVRIPTSPSDAGRLHRVRAAVTAATGERIEADALLEVVAAEARLEVTVPPSLVAGSPAPVTVRLTDLEGDPLDGRVTVTVRGPDGVTLERESTTTTRGKGSVTIAWSEEGQHMVEATAADAAGRPVTAATTAWVQPRQEQVPAGLTLETAPSYRLDAPITLTASTRSATPTLVVLEGEGLLGARILPAGSGTASFPAGSADGPMLGAVALQVVPEAGFQPRLEEAYATVQMADHPRGLQVTVTPDRTSYANGEVARILVEVRDMAGRPVQAEVALSMVDEALLALRAGWGLDPLAALAPATGRGGASSQSWGTAPALIDAYAYKTFDVAATGGLMAPAPTASPSPPMLARDRADGDDDGMRMMYSEALGDGMAGVPVRATFPETGLWAPQLETDSDGVLRIEVALPDSLTAWRVDAVAVTQHGQAGNGTATLATRRDVEADLFVPRFLVDGDATTIQATVMNRMPSTADIEVLLDVAGARLTGPAGRTVTLAPGQGATVSFPVATDGSGTAAFTLYAWAPEARQGDAIVRAIPVQPHGVDSTFQRSGRGAADFTMDVPASAAEGRATLTFTLSPSVSNALVDALPYLTGFPYGCVEQTLSSFLPDVAVARAAAAYGIDPATIDAALDDQVAAGLEKLYGYQHASGAWGWWNDDPDNPYTTAYTVYGLAMAQEAGYDIDPYVLSRGVEALAAMAAGSSGALRAYQVYALSVADPGSAPDPVASREPAQLAMAILSAVRQGDTAWAREHVGDLTASAIRNGDLLHWPDPREEWTVHGMSSDTMVTALATRALLAAEPDHPDADAAVRWILSNRAGANWDTTKDTAEAIFALVDHVEASGGGSGATHATVTVDGERHDVTLGGGWGRQEPLKVQVGVGGHDVRIEGDGGALYWSAVATFADGGEPLRADGGAFRFERELLGPSGKPTDTLRVGQAGTVRLRLTALEDARYVQLSDPLPAGVEAEEPDVMPWVYRDCWDCYGYGSYTNLEYRDDRVEAFFAQVPAGTTVSLEYKVRATFPGTYHVLPPRASGMYDPTVAGHGDESSLTIEADPSLQVGRVVRVREGGEETLLVNLHPDGGIEPDVEVTLVDGTGGSETFDPVVAQPPHSGGTWGIAVQVEDDTRYVVVEADGARATVPVAATQAAPRSEPRFDESKETSWRLGTALRLESPLAPAGLPDFAARFAGDSADTPVASIGAAADRFTKVPAPWLPLVAAGLLAAALARRRDG